VCHMLRAGFALRRHRGGREFPVMPGVSQAKRSIRHAPSRVRVGDRGAREAPGTEGSAGRCWERKAHAGRCREAGGAASQLAVGRDVFCAATR